LSIDIDKTGLFLWGSFGEEVAETLINKGFPRSHFGVQIPFSAPKRAFFSEKSLKNARFLRFP
jgi:hypothetical protein